MSVFAGIKLPKVIYEVQSPHNGSIQVLKAGDVLKLRVGKYTQSMSHTAPSAKRLVWGKVVDVLQEQLPVLDNVLVLGLGGGTMQHFISQAFANVHITSVELDKVMIDVAKKFFDVAEIPNHTIINEDAFRVVVDPEKYDIHKDEFDVAVIDIFIEDKFPDLGTSGNFFGALKNLVRPEGLVIFNRIYLSHHQDDVNSFIELVENFYHDVQSLIVAGYTNSDNVLIYGRV